MDTDTTTPDQTTDKPKRTRAKAAAPEREVTPILKKKDRAAAGPLEESAQPAKRAKKTAAKIVAAVAANVEKNNAKAAEPKAKPAPRKKAAPAAADAPPAALVSEPEPTPAPELPEPPAAEQTPEQPAEVTFTAENGVQRTVLADAIVSIVDGKPIPSPRNPKEKIPSAVVQVRQKTNGAVRSIIAAETADEIRARLPEGHEPPAAEVQRIAKVERQPSASKVDAEAKRAARAQKAQDTMAALVAFVTKSMSENPQQNKWQLECGARATGLKFGGDKINEAVALAGVTPVAGRAKKEPVAAS